ncbi:hypothetical protein VTO42DRAFT_6072 [Malbranchea cinnamomea]
MSRRRHGDAVDFERRHRQYLEHRDPSILRRLGEGLANLNIRGAAPGDNRQRNDRDLRNPPRPNMEPNDSPPPYTEIDPAGNVLQPADPPIPDRGRNNPNPDLPRLGRGRSGSIHDPEPTSSSRQVECQCCFTDVPIKRTIACRGLMAHRFCADCIKKQAETQIGMLKCDMKCMTQDNCGAPFRPSKLNKILGQVLYDKLTSIQQHRELQEADIEGLHECPFCDFKAIAPPINEDCQFACQNPACRKISCRKCGKESHKGKTCEEVNKDRHLPTVHRIEEAMSEAVIRHCPLRGCNTPMVKEFGCNKLQCPRCGGSMCYICKKSIRGYEHFNVPWSTCPLFDNVHQEQIHDTEAARARDRATREALNANPDLKADDVQVKAPEQQPGRGRAPVAGAGGVHPVVFANNQAVMRPVVYQPGGPMAVAGGYLPQPWHGANVLWWYPNAGARPDANGPILGYPAVHQPQQQYPQAQYPRGGYVQYPPGNRRR